MKMKNTSENAGCTQESNNSGNITNNNKKRLLKRGLLAAAVAGKMKFGITQKKMKTRLRHVYWDDIIKDWGDY